MSTDVSATVHNAQAQLGAICTLKRKMVILDLVCVADLLLHHEAIMCMLNHQTKIIFSSFGGKIETLNSAICLGGTDYHIKV